MKNKLIILLIGKPGKDRIVSGILSLAGLIFVAWLVLLKFH
jgi:hypothetical protein